MPSLVSLVSKDDSKIDIMKLGIGVYKLSVYNNEVILALWV